MSEMIKTWQLKFHVKFVWKRWSNMKQKNAIKWTMNITKWQWLIIYTTWEFDFKTYRMILRHLNLFMNQKYVLDFKISWIISQYLNHFTMNFQTFSLRLNLFTIQIFQNFRIFSRSFAKFKIVRQKKFIWFQVRKLFKTWWS